MKQNNKYLLFVFLLFIITIRNEELYVDILGTNDTHGAGLEKEKEFNETKYQIGGYKLLSGVINILKKDNPKGTLWLDAGDQFQGTLENELTKGDLMTDFFNTMGLHAATIGNHEWDWGKERIIKLMNNANYKYLIANMKRRSKQQIDEEKNKIKETNDDTKRQKADLDIALEDRVNDYLNKVTSTRIFTLHDGKIKIGVIGLTTRETYETSAYPPNDYEISGEYAKKIMELAAQLRIKQGAHAVIVVSHVGLRCIPANEVDFRTFGVRKATDPEKDTISCLDKEIPIVLKKLPPYVIDGWVAGHAHETIHTFGPGFPIIQNPLGGKYTNVIRLKFQKVTGGSYKVLTKQAEIQGPIPICSHIFKSTNICEFVPEKTYDEQLIEVKFRDQTLTSQIDQKVVDLIETKYKQVLQDVLKERNNYLFEVDKDFVNVKKDFNPLGALLSQAMRSNFLNKISEVDKDLKVDPNKVITIFGTGGFRSTFYKGKISEEDMKTMFPFKGQIVYTTITGTQLLKTIEVLQAGRKAFYCFTGLSMSVYLNPNTSYQAGSARLNDGTQIVETDKYLLVTFEFNLKGSGGDDFSILFKNKVYENIQYKLFGLDLNGFKDGFEKDKLYHFQDIINNANLKVIK